MGPIEYTKKLRWLAMFSWVSSLVIFLGLAKLHIIPSNEALPFLALLVGSLPIAAFMLKNKAICESCGGQMKISSGYPRIIYQCKECQAIIDTGIYSD